MNFNNIKDLVKHCGTTIHKLQYLKANKYIQIPPKIGGQYDGYYEIPQKTIDIIQKMIKLNRTELANMTSIKDHGCIIQSSWSWKGNKRRGSKAESGKHGANFIKALEQRKKELDNQ